VARAAGDGPRLLVRYDDPKNQPLAADEDLALRPNLAQPLYLAVEPGKTNKTVVVELRVNGRPVAKTAAIPLEGGGSKQPVVFGKPSPLPKQDKDWPPVLGPPFAFDILLSEVGRDNKEKELQRTSFSRFLLPPDYVRASSEYDSNRKVLTVTVEAREGFFGPPCPVELVLPGDRLPGFAESRDRAVRCELTRAGEKKKLYVKSLRFRPREDMTGYAYLTVDRCERAFVFKHDLGAKDGPDPGVPERTNRVRLQAPPFVLAGGDFPFRFQVDYRPQQSGGGAGPHPDEVVLEVVLSEDGTEKGEQFRKRFPPGYRRKRLSYAPAGPDGALVFRTEVADWTVADLDARKLEGALGRRFVRVRLLDRKNSEVLAGENGDLADSRTVEFVEKLPPVVTFAAKPATAEQDSKLVLQARPHPELAVRGLWVFLGEPENGKPPKSAVRAAPAPDQELAWVAELTVPSPADKKPIHVRLLAEGHFADGAPVTATDAFALQVVPPPPPRGIIQGKVTFADRPQPGCKVTLRVKKNNQWEKKDEAATNPSGEFAFKDLEPGTYQVSTFKPQDPAARGEKEVAVKARQATRADLDLRR
jgi:hypothetical protein